MSLGAILLVLSMSGWSNDTTFGDPNGSIVPTKQDSIRMRKEVLDISESSVQVEYEFVNTASKDTTVSITFPMPARYFGTADHSQIRDFRLLVDGTPTPTEHRVVVLLGDSLDITDRIRKLGWTETDIGQFLETGDQPEGKKPLPRKWLDKEGQARFTVNDHHIWSQTFPAGKTVSIRHSYRPSLTSGVPYPVDELVETYGKSSCIGSSTRARMKSLEGRGGVFWSRLEYILTTANNWQGPIGDFTLRVHKRTPGQIVSLCMDGTPEKTDAKTFEFHATEFHPVHNLDLLFVRRLDL